MVLRKTSDSSVMRYVVSHKYSNNIIHLVNFVDNVTRDPTIIYLRDDSRVVITKVVSLYL